MSTQPLRIYKEDLEKLKIAAASSGKDEKDILRELLGKAVPEEVQEELINLAKARAPSKRSSSGDVVSTPVSTTVQIGERVKSIIADAVETRVYLRTLGIDLGDQRQNQQQPYPYPPQYGYPQPPEQKKDIREWIMELKALESLEKKETDPDIKEILKEQRETTKKLLEQTNKQPEKKEMAIEDLMKWMTFYRMAGQPEEAQKLQGLITEKLDEVKSKLHDTEVKLITQQADFQQKDLQRQINEIKSAPTELDQITRLSTLAKEDDAIRAYMNTKLGIKTGESMTPQKLKEYIEGIKVPLGDIIKGVGDFIQKRQTVTAPPPPSTAPPAEYVPSEEELATRSGVSEQLPRFPKLEKGVTFSEPEETPQPSLEEASLPPEETEAESQPPPPSPAKGEEKPKRRTKKE